MNTNIADALLGTDDRLRDYQLRSANRKCLGCGGELPHGRGPRKYCEPNCGVAPKTCVECGEAFQPDRYYQARLTCSTGCKNARMARRNRTTQRVNKSGGLTVTERGKIAAARRGTGAGTGYRKRDGRHEHRVVAERVLGRPLAPGEVVHHEDENKQNNDPSNLIVFASQADHARHHKLDHLGLSECPCDGIRLEGVMQP